MKRQKESPTRNNKKIKSFSLYESIDNVPSDLSDYDQVLRFNTPPTGTPLHFYAQSLNEKIKEIENGKDSEIRYGMRDESISTQDQSCMPFVIVMEGSLLAKKTFFSSYITHKEPNEPFYENTAKDENGRYALNISLIEEIINTKSEIIKSLYKNPSNQNLLSNEDLFKISCVNYDFVENELIECDLVFLSTIAIEKVGKVLTDYMKELKKSYLSTIESLDNASLLEMKNKFLEYNDNSPHLANKSCFDTFVSYCTMVSNYCNAIDCFTGGELTF